jgi:Meiotically up-regulated gene 113
VTEPWLDKRACAAHFGCSVRSIELAITEGMPHAVIFGRVKLQAAEVEAWLERRDRQTQGDDDRLVYFVQAESGGPVKIGSAADPEERLRTLQAASAERLVIRGVRLGGFKEERRLHRRFARYHLRGEWFEPREELLALAVDAA